MSTLLFVGHEASRTGAPMSLLAIIRELTKQGIACELLLLRGGPLVEEYRACCPVTILAPPLPSRPAGGNFIGWWWYAGRKLLTKISDKTIFYVHVWLFIFMHKHRVSTVILNSVVSGKIAFIGPTLNAPVITYIHELAHGMAQGIHPMHLAKLLELSQYFIAPAPCVADHLIKTYGIDPSIVSVIPEAVEDPLRDTMPSAPDAPFVVAMAGTIDWRKGIDLFIHLGRILAPKLPQAQFVWVGGGAEYADFLASYRATFKLDESLAARFRFIGEQKNASTILSSCSIFALTSREDPLPLVHIEAAMLRKPIVCFAASGGAPEWINDAGVVVPYGDVAAMAEAIVDLAHHPERRTQMGDAGRTMMLARCLPSIVSQQILDVITKVQSPSTHPSSPRG